MSPIRLPSLLPAHLVLAVPEMRVADPQFNLAAILALMDTRLDPDAQQLFLFPELSLSGSSAGDLLALPPLAEACLQSLLELEAACQKRAVWAAAGLPLRSRWGLHNAAALLSPQGLLGFSIPDPKTGAWQRPFSPPQNFEEEAVDIGGRFLPVGSNARFDLQGFLTEPVQLWVGVPNPEALDRDCGLVLSMHNLPALAYGVNQPEDWAANLSRRYNRSVATCSAGPNESTTDQVYSGRACFYQAGKLEACTRELQFDSQAESVNLSQVQRKRQPAKMPEDAGFMLSRTPFIDQAAPKSQFQRVLDIQAAGLAKRLMHIGTRKVVLGLSGGADSSLALLVCLRAFGLLGYPAEQILAVSMPGPGSSLDSQERARNLAKLARVSLREIPISAAVDLHLRDIAHPEGQFDLTYENAQARERTQILMDLANQQGALMVGTGDLSEIALGWSTFNGDHISFYNVNAGVPKTLLLQVLAWAGGELLGKEGKVLAERIANASISPELLPLQGAEHSQQSTEESIGPYLLHDFFLYHMLVLRQNPQEIFQYASLVFEEREPAEILKWLRVFYKRFFAAQFKRSASSDGPRVTEVSLSPRGSWVMPSDAVPALWLNQVDNLTQGLN